ARHAQAPRPRHQLKRWWPARAHPQGGNLTVGAAAAVADADAARWTAVLLAGRSLAALVLECAGSLVKAGKGRAGRRVLASRFLEDLAQLRRNAPRVGRNLGS